MLTHTSKIILIFLACTSLTAGMIIPFPGSAIYNDAVSRGIIKNPVTYLRHDCPIVNLTKMNQKYFMALIARIQALNGRTYHVLNDDELITIYPNATNKENA